MTNKPDPCREAFEKWAESINSRTWNRAKYLDKQPSGNYTWSQTMIAYTTFSSVYNLPRVATKEDVLRVAEAMSGGSCLIYDYDIREWYIVRAKSALTAMGFILPTEGE